MSQKTKHCYGDKMLEWFSPLNFTTKLYHLPSVYLIAFTIAATAE